MKTKNELVSIFLDSLQLPEYATRTKNYLSDRELLERLINNEDLGSLQLCFAIETLFESVGINVRENPDILKKLSDNYSINDVVDLVYRKQHKTIEELRQFFAEELGLSEAYRENPEIINRRIFDGVFHEYGTKRVSVTVAMLRLFEFAGVDSSNSRCWISISQNPKLEEIVEMADKNQP